MPFFNKALRTEKKIIDELHKFLRKSAKITRKFDGNKEVFYLDNMDISFDVKSKILKAADKRGTQIVAMNCDFTQDSDQQKKFDWFSHLLEYAREMYDKKNAKTAKKEKIQKAQQKVNRVNKALEQQEKTRIAAAQESLQRLARLK